MNLLYAASFFITSNPEALMELVEFASSNQKAFAFNLSATFLIEGNSD